MNTDFLQIGNGEAVTRDRIPHLSFDDFRSQALAIVTNGGRVVHFFGYPDGDGVNLLAVLRTDHLLMAGCKAPEDYPALTAECEPFHMFEREIAEQFGIRPQGHPWLKMVRYHPNERGLPDVFGNDYAEDIPGNYDYYSVEGDEILEIHLGYQHRGIENLFLNADIKRLPILAEGIAGDTAVGHSVCMAQAVEALAAIDTDAGARIIRTIGLELERLANHVGDLGALSGDVAFLPPANYCGRMRGDFLNMSLWICGNRFGKGLVRPGGVRFPLTDEDRRVLTGRLGEIKPQVEHTIDLLFSTSSVRARFEGCGVVSMADAEKLGLVGPAGRASGIAYDARRCFPTEHYPRLDIPENAEPTGDVYARAKVRADEVLQSIAIIESLLDSPIETRCVEDGEFILAPSSLAVTVNEGWRGEVSHCLMTDADGKIQRYKVKDPSFHNWNGLAMALRDTGISDFPLNNKSYNLSYCGFDL
jgi:Ni,Fe-hydrogenase III large subunit